MKEINQKTIPVIDGHIDILHRMLWEGVRFSENNESASADLPKLRAGGVRAAFFAIFQDPGKKKDLGFYWRAMDGLVREHERDLRVLEKPGDYEKLEDRIGVIIHVEGAHGIESIQALEELHARGLRSLGIVWDTNKYGYGAMDEKNRGKGLTREGFALVEECNELGIIVDVAHMNWKGIMDVVGASTRPVIASHANCYSLCKNPRNLGDEQIIAIADTGGVVGISFVPVFVKDLGLRPGELLPPVSDTVSMDEIIRHIEHIEELVGIDHVALGSDFDGGPIPLAMRDASRYPALANSLREHGYSTRDIRKIFHKNYLRVIRKTWSHYRH